MKVLKLLYKIGKFEVYINFLIFINFQRLENIVSLSLSFGIIIRRQPQKTTHFEIVKLWDGQELAQFDSLTKPIDNV
jgi:hypothetical protein